MGCGKHCVAGSWCMPQEGSPHEQPLLSSGDVHANVLRLNTSCTNSEPATRLAAPLAAGEQHILAGERRPQLPGRQRLCRTAPVARVRQRCHQEVKATRQRDLQHITTMSCWRRRQRSRQAAAGIPALNRFDLRLISPLFCRWFNFNDTLQTGLQLKMRMYLELLGDFRRVGDLDAGILCVAAV